MRMNAKYVLIVIKEDETYDVTIELKGGNVSYNDNWSDSLGDCVESIDKDYIVDSLVIDFEQGFYD